MIKIHNVKFVILLEYKNIKTFLQKAMFEIELKKLMLLGILKANKLLEFFTKKLSKSKSREFRDEKVINCILNEKATVVILTIRLIKIIEEISNLFQTWNLHDGE